MSLNFKSLQEIPKNSRRSRSRTKNGISSQQFRKSDQYFSKNYYNDFPPVVNSGKFIESNSGTVMPFSLPFQSDISYKNIVKPKFNNLNIIKEDCEKSFEEMRWEDYQKIAEIPKLANKQYTQCLIKNKLCCQKNQNFAQLHIKPELHSSKNKPVVNYLRHLKDEITYKAGDHKEELEETLVLKVNSKLNYLESNIKTPNLSYFQGKSSKSLNSNNQFPTQLFSTANIVNNFVIENTNQHIFSSKPFNTLNTKCLPYHSEKDTFVNPLSKIENCCGNSEIQLISSNKTANVLKQPETLPKSSENYCGEIPKIVSKEVRYQPFLLKSEVNLHKDDTCLIDKLPAITHAQSSNNLQRCFNSTANINVNKSEILKCSRLDAKLLIQTIPQQRVQLKAELPKINEESTTSIHKFVKEKSFYTINKSPPNIPPIFQKSIVTPSIHNMPVTLGSTSEFEWFKAEQLPSSHSSLFPNTTWFLRDNIADQFGFNQTLNSVQPMFEEGNMYAKCYGYTALSFDLFKTILPQKNPIISKRKDFQKLFLPYLKTQQYYKKDHFKNLIF